MTKLARLIFNYCKIITGPEPSVLVKIVAIFLLVLKIGVYDARFNNSDAKKNFAPFKIKHFYFPILGNYSCLKVELTFTRDRAFYFTTVFIPGKLHVL